MAWLLRSKYTPVKVSGGAITMGPLYLGLGLIALTLFCIMPTSCVDTAGERQQAVEEYKQQLESQRYSGVWYYGTLYPDRSINWEQGVWQTPATINTSGQELRFTFGWKENGRTPRTTSFSGERVKNRTDYVAFQGTWFVTNTRYEGEWTLFVVSEDYYCGWVKDKGDDEKRMIFLRRER